jgi:2,3-bisphosphoglycerate-dependent phosphoglycerate mutase
VSATVAALIRHGSYEQPENVPSAHLPHPLTEKGRREAAAAARPIREFALGRGLPLDPVIDASSLLRAYETALLLAAELGGNGAESFRVESFDELAERSLGAAANLTLAEIERILDRDPRYESRSGDWKRDGRYRLPWIGAESLAEAGERVARHLVRRLGGEPGGRPRLKVFVGHGGAFRHAAVVLGALAARDVDGLSMYHGRPVFLEMKEDGTFRHVGGDWKVRASVDPSD